MVTSPSAHDPDTMSSSLRWALATLAGFLNGAAFVYVGALALIANVPLLLALRGCRRPWIAAGLGGWVGFLGGVHIYGIVDYGWLLFWGFALYTGSQMVLYGVLIHGLWGRRGRGADVLLPALVWGLTEWIRTLGPLAMPASYVGCIAEVGWLRPWLALAATTGGLGVSFSIALVQSVVFHAIVDIRAYARPLGIAAGALGAIGVAGLLAPPALGEQPISIVGVQGGLPNDRYAAALADPAVMREVVGTYERLTQRAYATGADLVVWPETALRVPVLRRPELRHRLLPGPNDRSVLIAGLPTNDANGQRHNAALAIAPGGVVLDGYHKVRLVPNHEAEYTPGIAWSPLRTPVASVGVMICLESVYPQSARELTQKGAELLLVLSNDAGFRNTPISRHMTHRSIVRAVENGRWLLRVGQAGISALIDPTGRVHARLPLFKPALLRGQVRLRRDLTPFARWGNVCVLLIIAALAVVGLRARRRGPRAAC